MQAHEVTQPALSLNSSSLLPIRDVSPVVWTCLMLTPAYSLRKALIQNFKNISLMVWVVG